MANNQLSLPKGKWLLVNCGKFPSAKNCQLVLMAPESHREDLLDAVVSHAVKFHGHKDDQELRQNLNKSLEKVDL